MRIVNKDKLGQKVANWIMSLDYDTKEDVLNEVIMRLIETEEVNWSDDRKCPYWDSNGEELGEYR